MVEKMVSDIYKIKIIVTILDTVVPTSFEWCKKGMVAMQIKMVPIRKINLLSK